jgi:hypothetical protein
VAFSGTTTFEKTFSIDDIITESFERLGFFDYSGNDLRSARRSLNILFQDWQNRGAHYWEIAENTFTLVADQPTYTMFRSTADGTSDATAVYGASDILEASYRTTSNVDTPLSKINRSQYSAFSNKTATGQPSQYWVQRFIDRVTVTLYLTPGTSQAGNFMAYFYVKRIQDAGAYTNEADVVNRFVPAMCAGLTYLLSMKKAPQRTQELKLIYEDEINRALQEDGSPASVYISPKTYYPEI